MKRWPQTYFEYDHVENLGVNSFWQGEDGPTTYGHDEEHANDLPKSKNEQGEPLRRSRAVFPDLYSKSTNFPTLVTWSMGDLGLTLCLTLPVQEVTFPTKQVSSHLDVICPLKSASKANLSNLSFFDHLICVDDFYQMVVLNLVKLFLMENRLYKISYDSRIIKFGPETRELWLIQFDPIAVIMRWRLSEFNAMKILTPREQVDGHPISKLHLPILRWEFKTPTLQANGNKSQGP